MAMSPLRDLLVSTQLQALREENDHIVVLRSTATVDAALRVLAKYGFLSAPVVACPTGVEASDIESALWPADQPADILGFVDIHDVLQSFLKEVDFAALQEMKLLQRMRTIEELGAAFAKKQIKDLTYMGYDGDLLHSTQAKASLLEFISYALLDPGYRGMHEGKKLSRIVHRVALFSSKGIITNVISQTDVIRFLADRPTELGSAKDLTVSQLGWDARPVESVEPSACALDAMARMDAAGVSALPVIGQEGQVLGNFSVSEMRTIMAEHFGALALPVGEFLALGNSTEYVFNRPSEDGVALEESKGHLFVRHRSKRLRAPSVPGQEVGQHLVLATGSTPLLQVMRLLVDNKVHRVYVVDEQLQPKGVITCTDVLRKIIELAEN